MSRPALAGDDDNAIDDGFGFLGGAQRFFVVDLADRISAIGDDDHDFSVLTAAEGLRAEKDSVIERGCGARAVGGSDYDQHAGFADFDTAKAVDDRHSAHLEASACLARQVPDLFTTRYRGQFQNALPPIPATD